MIRLCVLGPSGRTGGEVLALARSDFRFELAGVVDRPGSPLLGEQAVAGVTISDDLATGIGAAEVYVDFTTPASTAAALAIASERGTAAVIGTTGLGPEVEAALAAAADKIPVLTAANFSLGVNLLLGLAETAARALGPEFDLEVVEIHHGKKRDAPSGTAIALGKALAAGRGVDYEEHRRYAREGEVGARPAGEIGISAVRGGDVVGEHTAFFFGPNERLELTHRAGSRAIFAAGALSAAAWIAGKPAGRYTMRDVLGLD